MCRTMSRDVALNHALGAKGFRLMDTLVTYLLDLRHVQLDPSRHVQMGAPPIIREAVPDDVPVLEEIARASFADRNIWLDRFHADPRIPKAKADDLYVQWIRNSITPQPADEAMANATFVAETPDPRTRTIAGFLTCRRGGARSLEPGVVSLNAVAKLFRGRGYYWHLVHHAIQWFRDEGMTAVSVRTSVASQAVQRTWIRLGAIPGKFEHTFHWWAD